MFDTDAECSGSKKPDNLHLSHQIQLGFEDVSRAEPDFSHHGLKATMRSSGGQLSCCTRRLRQARVVATPPHLTISGFRVDGTRAPKLGVYVHMNPHLFRTFWGASSIYSETTVYGYFIPLVNHPNVGKFAVFSQNMCHHRGVCMVKRHTYSHMSHMHFFIQPPTRSPWCCFVWNLVRRPAEHR